MSAAWSGRAELTDFDVFDESALLARTVRDGRGYHAVKSRTGVPLRAAFLAGATDPPDDPDHMAVRTGFYY